MDIMLIFKSGVTREYSVTYAAPFVQIPLYPDLRFRWDPNDKLDRLVVKHLTFQQTTSEPPFIYEECE